MAPDHRMAIRTVSNTSPARSVRTITERRRCRSTPMNCPGALGSLARSLLRRTDVSTRRPQPQSESTTSGGPAPSSHQGLSGFGQLVSFRLIAGCDWCEMLSRGTGGMPRWPGGEQGWPGGLVRLRQARMAVWSSRMPRPIQPADQTRSGINPSPCAQFKVHVPRVFEVQLVHSERGRRCTDDGRHVP